MRVSAHTHTHTHTCTYIHICAFNHNLKTEIKCRTLRNFPEICVCGYIAHLPQRCQNSKSVIFQEKLLKVLKSYNFLRVQRRHNCSPAANFANCVMTLYLLKVYLQTFLSIAITQKMPNFELWHSCRKWAICFTRIVVYCTSMTSLLMQCDYV
jgi:hypothetical protein